MDTETSPDLVSSYPLSPQNAKQISAVCISPDNDVNNQQNIFKLPEKEACAQVFPTASITAAVDQLSEQVFLMRNYMGAFAEALLAIQQKIDIISVDYDSFLEHRHFVKTEIQAIKTLSSRLDQHLGFALSNRPTASQSPDSLSHATIIQQFGSESLSPLPESQSKPQPLADFQQDSGFALPTQISASQCQSFVSPLPSNSSSASLPIHSRWAVAAANIPSSFKPASLRPAVPSNKFIFSSSQLLFSGEIPSLSQQIPQIKKEFVEIINSQLTLDLKASDIKSIQPAVSASKQPKILVTFADPQHCLDIWDQRRLLHAGKLFPEQQLTPKERNQQQSVIQFFKSHRIPAENGPHQFNFNVYSQGVSIKIVKDSQQKYFYSLGANHYPLDVLKYVGIAQE